MAGLVALVVLLWFPLLASAHGFGQRIDLPLPLNTYLFGAGAVVALSFLLIGLIRHKGAHFEEYSHYNLLHIGFVRDVCESKTFLETVKTAFVFLLGLVVLAGFIGRNTSTLNIAPTVVWILFSVGLTYFSALIGNVWQLINPFKTLYEWFEKLGLRSLERQWPKGWGVWPALLGFFLFRWIENVYPGAAVPSLLVNLVVLYSVITFIGMFYFGKEKWLRYGDPFSVFFRLLSHFSITEFRVIEGKKELNVRPPGVGLFSALKSVDISVVWFLLLMLTSVSFDGVKATPLWFVVANTLYHFGFSSSTIGTVGFVLLLGFFVGIYFGFSRLVRSFARSTESTTSIARTFIVSLLPIAIVYEIAHFVTLLLIDGQRIISLVSDPFGFGWDLFNTAEYVINYRLVDLKALWNLQVALIIIGHVIAVYVAHVIAVRTFKDEAVAVRSQFPMLILMVLYTMLGLWILAQPIVAGFG